MTIYNGSRYENAIIDYFALENGGDAQPVLFYPFPDIGKIYYFEYEWLEDDRLDLLSIKFYGRPDLWWLILDFNPEIKDPQRIAPGTVIRIVNA